MKIVVTMNILIIQSPTRRLPELRYLSTTLFGSMSMSGCMLSNAKPTSLLSVIVVLSQVIIRRKVGTNFYKYFADILIKYLYLHISN